MKNKIIFEFAGISIVKTEWLNRALKRIRTEKLDKEIAQSNVKWEKAHKIQTVVRFERPKIKTYNPNDLPDNLIEIK